MVRDEAGASKGGERGGTRARGIGLAIAACVVAIIVLGVWDQNREAEAALADLGGEASMLASMAAAGLRTRLEAGLSFDRVAADAGVVLEGDRSVVLVRSAGAQSWTDPTGGLIDVPVLSTAAAAGSPWTLLSRPEARTVGLAERTAVAGVSTFDAPALGRWSVAVVLSAAHERDRVKRARVRLVLGLGLVAGIVGLFGAWVLRGVRKEHALETALTRAELQRRRERELVRENRAATTVALATGVAHQIATPLSVIAGRAEQLALRGAGDDSLLKATGVIGDQVARIRDVIYGFLELVRSAPVVEDVTPGAIAEDAMQMVAHRFDAAGVSLRAEIPAALPRLRGDGRLLEQALVNLLLNACEASAPRTHVRLQADVEGRFVRFEVHDEGAGVPADFLVRRAELFATPRTGAPRARGVGALGLAVADEIAHLHGGDLGLEPLPSRGTRARLRIPLPAEARP
jgi:signal transduction histidine kinase